MQSQATYRYQGRALLRLGLPLIGGHLASFAIHITDTVMLGWYDANALAAMVLGGTLFFVTLIVGSGFAQALMPVVAAAVSSGETPRVRRATRMAMWISVAFGALAMPIFLLAETILLSIGQNPWLSDVAGSYLTIAGWGLIPALLVWVMRSYLSALERTQVVLWVTVGTAALNAVINYALIFGNWGAPELGIRGAALASVSVQLAGLLALTIYVMRVTPEHTLFQRLWRPDWAALIHIFQLGWPIGLTMLAEVGLFSASAIMMGWVGTVELAAHGIAIQLASLAFLVHLGLSNAATIRAGQAWGKSDMTSLRQISVSTSVLSGGFALVAIAIFVAFAPELLGLFMDPQDPVRPDVIAVGTGLLYVAALFQLADAGQVQALGLLRGMQDTRAPMVMAALSYWAIGLPISYLLGFVLGLGGIGIWLGLTVGLVIAWTSMGARLYRKAFRAVAVAS